MSKVKLSISQMTPDQLSLLAGAVVLATDNKAQFSTIQPLTSGLKDAHYPVALLSAQIKNLRDQLEVLVPQRDELIPALDVALEAHASGVDGVAKGAKSVIEAAGYEATADRQAPSPLGQVQDFAVSMGDAAGEADWHCDPLERSTAFEARWTLTPADPASWQSLALEFPSRSKGTFTGLPSGQIVTFQLRGTGGTTGHGPWSALASCRVP